MQIPVFHVESRIDPTTELREIRFTDSLLSDPKDRVWLAVQNSSLNDCCTLCLKEKENHEIALIKKKELKKYFQISNKIILGLPMNIVLIKLYRMLQANLFNPSAIQKMAKFQVMPIHFSKKDFGGFCPIYFSRDFQAIGIPNSLIFKNSKTKIKKAMLLDPSHELVVRKIRYLQCSWINPERLAWIANRLQDCKGVVPTYGQIMYSKKLVTFHPLYKYDLDRILLKIKTRELSPEIRNDFSLQVLEILANIKGAHGDVKPENILVKFSTREIAFTDFECYIGNEETHNHTSGTIKWMAPEVLKEEPTITSKIDVWPAALVILKILCHPKFPDFPWWNMEDVSDIKKWMTQAVIDKALNGIELPAPVMALIRRMLVVDKTKRCTIQEAYQAFKIYYEASKLK